MFFPVVTYRCENWTITKAEHRRTDAFELVMDKTLESPKDCTSKPINPKGNQSEYSLEGLMLKLKLQYFGHLMQRANSLENTLMLGKSDSRRRRGRQRCLDGIVNSTDMSLSKLWEIVKERGGWPAVAHGVTKSWI